MFAPRTGTSFSSSTWPLIVVWPMEISVKSKAIEVSKVFIVHGLMIQTCYELGVRTIHAYWVVEFLRWVVY